MTQPPSDAGAESGVLGCCLLDYEKAVEFCIDQGLVVESFYVPAHRVVWQAMVDLYTAGKAVDPMTVTAALKASGRLDEAGGALALGAHVDAAITPAHIAHYCEIVKARHLARLQIQAARQAEQSAYGTNTLDEAEQARSAAEYALATCNIYYIQQRRTSLADALKRQNALWEQAAQTGCAGIPTGIPVLDRYFGGLMESALYYISGQPGSCKTTLARQIARNLAKRGVPVALFSLEQTTEQIAGSLEAAEARQSVWKLNSGVKHGVDYGHLVCKGQEVAAWPLHIRDEPQNQTTLWSACRSMVGRQGVKVLILDYIQAMLDSQRHSSMDERNASYSATIRDIAKTLRVPFVVVSALNQQDRLRGSGLLNYDAWAHIRLEKQRDSNIVTFHFEKQRFGPPANSETMVLDEHGNELESPEAEGERRWYEEVETEETT